jgi:type IV secretion system protein VirB6
VYVVIGLATLYVAFLMTLALVALGIILALGPIFIGLVFFDSTKRFFEAWIAQLANYAIVIILTATAANFMLRTIRPPLLSAVASGSSITAAEGLRLAVFCIFMFLILRQVLPMAAGLASGIALSTGNLVSGALGWGLGRTRNMGRGVWDAMTGQGTTRWDSSSRKAGYWTARSVGTTAAALWRLRPGARNTIRPRSSSAAKNPAADVPPSARN